MDVIALAMVGAQIIAIQVASTVGEAVDTWGNAAAIAGGFGFVIWFARYTVSVTIPQMAEAFRADFDKQRTAYAEEFDKQRKQSSAESAAMRAMYTNALSEIRTSFEKQCTEQRQDFHAVLERREQHTAQLLERLISLQRCKADGQVHPATLTGSPATPPRPPAKRSP